jgi:hypothetical protein
MYLMVVQLIRRNVDLTAIIKVIVVSDIFDELYVSCVK